MNENDDERNERKAAFEAEKLRIEALIEDIKRDNEGLNGLQTSFNPVQITEPPMPSAEYTCICVCVPLCKHAEVLVPRGSQFLSYIWDNKSLHRFTVKSPIAPGDVTGLTPEDCEKANIYFSHGAMMGVPDNYQWFGQTALPFAHINVWLQHPA